MNSRIRQEWSNKLAHSDDKFHSNSGIKMEGGLDANALAQLNAQNGQGEAAADL